MFVRTRAQRAVVVVTVTVLATLFSSCASSRDRANPASPTWVGWTWRIVEVQHGTARTSIPAALNGSVAFAPDRTLRADDAVNAYFGSYALDGEGYRPHDVGTTLVGYAGHDPARLDLIAAVRALTGSEVVIVGAAADTLQLSAGGYTVRCAKLGIAHDEAPPSPTATHP